MLNAGSYFQSRQPRRMKSGMTAFDGANGANGEMGTRAGGEDCGVSQPGPDTISAWSRN
jgi:hypothetical protein